MKLYWKDTNTNVDRWPQLEIEISEATKPAIRVMAGSGLKFKIQHDNMPIAWGRVASDYYGCWYLRNQFEWNKVEAPITPITSNDVERSLEHQTERERLTYWGKFFLDALSKSNATIFYNGTWELSVALHDESHVSPFSSKHWKRFNSEKVFYPQRPLWIDWDFRNTSPLLSLKSQPSEDNGRTKWWRKKVREGTCPPVLAWFISALDSFVIIDGHCRMQAYELEHIKPTVLVLNAIQKVKITPDRATQESILRGLENRKIHPLKKDISVDLMNSLLISAFDDRPYNRPITSSIAKRDFAKEWLDELLQFKNDSDIDQEELEGMIAGQ
ncbi:hypothetical protein [Catalinimonas alkaloidigena]|nr:hypothetical protein [Catalinimonas alkaloidigena]